MLSDQLGSAQLPNRFAHSAWPSCGLLSGNGSGSKRGVSVKGCFLRWIVPHVVCKAAVETFILGCQIDRDHKILPDAR